MTEEGGLCLDKWVALNADHEQGWLVLGVVV